METKHTRKSAGMLGLGIFAIMGLMSPSESKKNVGSPGTEENRNQNLKSGNIHFQSNIALNISEIVNAQYSISTKNRMAITIATGASDTNAKTGSYGNATLLDHGGWVSSCKPSYYGFLGLGSLIDNAVRWCETQDIIKLGERVEILKNWRTGLRGYWYCEINYVRDGVVKTGWIHQGDRDNKWSYVKPDFEENPFASSSH